MSQIVYENETISKVFFFNLENMLMWRNGNTYIWINIKGECFMRDYNRM